MSVPAARAIDAVKIYGSGDTAVRALDAVTLGFDGQAFSAIMGPSGSGKSTLLHCLAGLDRLTSGQAWLGETELGRLDNHQLTLVRRDRLGFIFQAYNLVPTLTVSENIALPMRLAGRDPDEGWVQTVVDLVDLRGRLSHLPSQLSGGQQQRAAAARALASKPAVVFADEPTGNLDSASGEVLLGLLRRAVDDFGATVVMVTHDPAAAAHADRVLFLADGRVVDDLDRPTTDRVLETVRRMS
ncbi:MAG: ABC transporter ATP-binding protein [Acidimicrobiales bacterium]